MSLLLAGLYSVWGKGLMRNTELKNKHTDERGYSDSGKHYEESKAECCHVVESHSEEVTSG